MNMRLNLLGSCSAHLEVEGATLPMTTSLKVLVHLAIGPSQGWYRSELALALWPEDEPSICLNRLRVALSKLKKRAPGAVLDDQGRLRLNQEAVTLDFAVLRQAAAEVEDQVSPHLELQGWLSLKDQLSEKFGDPFRTDALKAARLEWSHWASGKLARGSELALAQNRPEAAKQLASAALSQVPSNSAALSALKSAGRELGSHPVYGLRADVEHKLDGLNLADPKSDENLADGRPTQEPRLLAQSHSSTNRPHFASSFLEGMVKNRPDLALPLLAAPELMPLVGADPRQSALLMESVVMESDADLPGWVRCAARLTALWAWLDEVEKARNLAPKVLARSDDPVVRRAVFNALASVNAVKGEWSQAEASLKEAEALAKLTGSNLDPLTVQGSRACHLWMQGRFAESELLYEQVFEGLEGMDDPRALFELSVAKRNRAYIPMMQGEFAKAREALLGAKGEREALGVVLPAGLDGPCIVMLNGAVGISEGAAYELKTHLMSFFEQGSLRLVLVGLEFGACTLLWLGRRPGALRVLKWLERERRSHGFPRCPAEELMVAQVIRQTEGWEQGGAQAPPVLPTLEELGAWIVKEVRLGSQCSRSVAAAAPYI